MRRKRYPKKRMFTTHVWRVLEFHRKEEDRMGQDTKDDRMGKDMNDDRMRWELL